VDAAAVFDWTKGVAEHCDCGLTGLLLKVAVGASLSSSSVLGQVSTDDLADLLYRLSYRCRCHCLPWVVSKTLYLMEKYN
jgi:hypothetical protein